MRALQFLTIIFVLMIVIGTEILADTKVVTYVVKTQEERHSTRWTLTEWLRIKERMKMMDVWLAMFSNPKKDRFSPEMQISYAGMQATPEVFVSGDLSSEESVTSNVAKVDLWMTNLFTGMTGVRLLNVDLGVVGAVRGVNQYSSDIAAPEGKAKLAGFARANYGIGLRVFGKNVQDSSLTLSYGNYEWVPRAWLRGNPTVTDGRLTGNQASASLRLYLSKVIGIEASGTQFMAPTLSSGSDSWSGQSVDYGAFVEVSLIKIFGGLYREQWSLTQPKDDTDFKIDENGYHAGIALSI